MHFENRKIEHLSEQKTARSETSKQCKDRHRLPGALSAEGGHDGGK